MKNLPVHENLDTSFVNLSALVRFLRRRQFVGSIRVELNGYEADIEFDESNQLKVREHDRIAGRIAQGEEAFQRLLIRAREPGGTINVFQLVEETESLEQKIQTVVTENNGKPFVQREILEQIPDTTNGGTKKEELRLNKNGNGNHNLPSSSASPKNLSPLPLDFSNRVEERARLAQNVSPQEWQNFLQLTAELLGAIDETLAAAGLDFQAAFAKACSEISGDYPFLDPTAGVFSYKDQTLAMGEQTNVKLFAGGINEALRRILEKLRSNPKFTNVYRQTAQKILSLIHSRKASYDKFFITPQLEKSLGI